MNPEEFKSVAKIKQQNRKRKLELLEMIVKKQVPKLNALNIQYNRRHSEKIAPGPGSYNLVGESNQPLVQSSAFKSKITKTLFETKDSFSNLRGPGSYDVP